ncbi:MAG: malate dehydrogenase [Candidatus Promineifilaceae bacterium]|nr:malate dehydrogenase [Candidatus Promineifilaceae bacterium]
MSKVVKVAVTGAAGQIGYALLPRLANGEVFGPHTSVDLHLLEITPALPILEGVVMEMNDCAFPLLNNIVVTDDPKVAFDGINWALFVGAKPRGKGMERGDLIRENGPIFVGQGQALNERAADDVRVVVVGNPANTNCLIAMNNAPDIPKERFSALTRLDQNRAYAQLAEKAGVTVNDVRKVTIWGNHSATQYPDVENAEILGRPLFDVITDHDWLRGDFISTVQKRGAAIIQARGKSSAMSAASATLDQVRSLLNPTDEGNWFSAAVVSDGSYGVDEGLIFSYPLRNDGSGSYEIVQDLSLSDFGRQKIQATLAELRDERDTVADLLQ